jgi:hypothetical protein
MRIKSLTGEVDAIEERWLYKRVDYRLGKLSSVNAPDFSICDTGGRGHQGTL